MGVLADGGGGGALVQAVSDAAVLVPELHHVGAALDGQACDLGVREALLEEVVGQYVQPADHTETILELWTRER